MPELVAGGPAIPVRLLNELDSGKVVFFCGAGVSMGPGSDLPDFLGLVQHVYDANRITPDAVEKEALNSKALDKALGLLERDERLGAHAVRRTVIERLSAPPSDELHLHKALIDLSRNEQGLRLITTNFDDRFVEADLDEEVDASPKLPLPKPHTWSSLVHLHGRIAGNEDGSNLVLTASDFGRAYLTERWAARFVTELFREFTVVFVGYSVGDPVMSYMVDALAAERAKGARIETAYAFADADGSEAGNTKVRDGWRAKNVEPIVYDPRDGHRLLADTLIEWASVGRERIWRERIHPWLLEYWPQAAARNTAGTSEAILELLAECGEAFAQATEWSLDYLRPLEGRGLYRLNENGHAEQYPESMLRVLDRVVDAEVLQVYERYHLREILDALVEANAGMAGDPRFRRLYRIAAQ